MNGSVVASAENTASNDAEDAPAEAVTAEVVGE